MNQSAHNSMNYSDINPYEMMYRNINIKIDESISRQHAEIVAKQLGYMHNAFGVVVKDFIKILAFKFKNNEQPGSGTYQRRDNSKIQYPNYIEQHRQDPQPMQIQENHTYSAAVTKPNKNRPRDAQKLRIVLPQVERKELTVANQKQNNQDEKPPNVDLFNQFAFEKEDYEDIKKPIRDTKKVKQGIARIIEEASNKKKKIETKKNKSAVQNIYSNNIQNENAHHEQFLLRNENKAQFHNKRQQNSKQQQINIQKQNNVVDHQKGIFDQFSFQKHQKSDYQSPNIDSQIFQPNQIIKPTRQSKHSEMWQFLKPASKQHPVYEISDDEAQ